MVGKVKKGTNIIARNKIINGESIMIQNEDSEEYYTMNDGYVYRKIILSKEKYKKIGTYHLFEMDMHSSLHKNYHVTYESISLIETMEKNIECTMKFFLLPKTLDSIMYDITLQELKHVLKLFYIICKHVHRLHKKTIIHMHLNYESIYLDHNNYPYLNQFDSCLFNNQTQPKLSKLPYYHKTANINASYDDDIHSICIIFLEILTKKRIVTIYQENEVDMINKAFQLYVPRKYESIKPLLLIMLEEKNMENVLFHPVFDIAREISSSTENICEENTSIVQYDMFMRDCIKNLLSQYMIHFRGYEMHIYCMHVDIYYRYYRLLCLRNIKLTKKDHQEIAIACMMIVFKYFERPEDFSELKKCVDKSIVTKDLVLKREMMIINELQCQLYDNFYFELCKNNDDLSETYTKIIAPHELSYFNYTRNTYEQYLSQSHPSDQNKENIYNSLIQDLF